MLSSFLCFLTKCTQEIELLTSHGMYMVKVNIHFLLKSHLYVVLWPRNKSRLVCPPPGCKALTQPGGTSFLWPWRIKACVQFLQSCLYSKYTWYRLENQILNSIGWNRWHAPPIISPINITRVDFYNSKDSCEVCGSRILFMYVYTYTQTRFLLLYAVCSVTSTYSGTF